MKFVSVWWSVAHAKNCFVNKLYSHWSPLKFRQADANYILMYVCMYAYVCVSVYGCVCIAVYMYVWCMSLCVYVCVHFLCFCSYLLSSYLCFYASWWMQSLFVAVFLCGFHFTRSYMAAVSFDLLRCQQWIVFYFRDYGLPPVLIVQGKSY